MHKKILYNLFNEKGDFTKDIGLTILQFLSDDDLLSIIKVGLKETIWKKIVGDFRELMGWEEIRPIIEQILKLQEAAYALLRRRWQPKQIFCEYNHTFVLTINGTVLCCGNNKYGQLGNGNFGTYSTILQRAILNGKAKQIACGRDYIIVLMKDGKVFSCGSNKFGQLGDNRNRSKPNSCFQQINLPRKAKQISCRYWQTFILMENDTVLSFGTNTGGQLANPYNTYPLLGLREINLNGKVKQVFCGTGHTFALMKNDKVFSCGGNKFGQLGCNRNVGIHATNADFQQVNLHGEIKQISCGTGHTVLLMKDGKVFSCGSNKFGQLGCNRNVGTDLPNSNFQQISLNGKAKQIACGHIHTVVLMENGTVLNFGCNINGQLGRSVNFYSPVLRRIDLPYKVKQIACGMEHTVLLMENDIMVSCGLNEHGQLGRKLGLFRSYDSTFKKCYFFRDILKKALSQIK